MTTPNSSHRLVRRFSSWRFDEIRETERETVCIEDFTGIRFWNRISCISRDTGWFLRDSFWEPIAITSQINHALAFELNCQFAIGCVVAARIWMTSSFEALWFAFQWNGPTETISPWVQFFRVMIQVHALPRRIPASFISRTFGVLKVRRKVC